MDNLRGALLMVLAMLGFAIEDMFIKMMSGALPVGQILVLLGAGGAAVFAVIVRMQGLPLFSRAMLTGPVVLRGLGEMVGTIGFVSAIILTTISSASAILQATPLVVTLGAALFLGERVGWRRWTAILVGFCGVLLIIRPGLEGFSPLSLLALMGVAGLAIRDVATRKVPETLTSMQLSFLGFLVVIPAGLMLLWLTGTPLVPLTTRVTLLMAASISIGVFAYYGIVAAMRVGDVSFVTPFRYVRIIFALIVGVSIFGETPDLPTLIGAAIIVTSGIYTVWRESQHQLSLSKPPAAG